jgi:hypothetical protein
MRDVHAHDKAVVNIYEQPELPVETREKRQTLVFTDSEYEAIQKDAVAQGYDPDRFGAHTRKLALLGLKVRKKMNLTLEDILL